MRFHFLAESYRFPRMLAGYLRLIVSLILSLIIIGFIITLSSVLLIIFIIASGAFWLWWKIKYGVSRSKVEPEDVVIEAEYEIIDDEEPKSGPSS